VNKLTATFGYYEDPPVKAPIQKFYLDAALREKLFARFAQSVTTRGPDDGWYK